MHATPQMGDAMGFEIRGTGNALGGAGRFQVSGRHTCGSCSRLE
jgi:hypothetical protein